MSIFVRSVWLAVVALAISVANASGEKKKDSTPAGQGITVKIKSIENVRKVSGRDIANADILLDRKVPNGQATLVLELMNGQKVRLGLWPVSQTPSGEKVALGQPTDRLQIQWSPRKDQLDQNEMQGKSGRFYSRDNLP